MVKKIGVEEKDVTSPNPLTLYTMTDPTTVDCQLVSGLKVQGYKQNYSVKLPLITTTNNKIPINRKHIPTKEMAEKWKHLRLIPPSMALDVGLLLGANCNPAHVPLETVANSPEEPYAKRTVLGWSFTGSNSNQTCQTTYSHRVMTHPSFF